MRTLAVWGVALFACSAWATDGPDEPPDDGRGVIRTDKRTFHLPVNIADNARPTLKEVQLFVSEDRGKTWKKAAAAPVSGLSAFRFTAPRNGPYWFAVRTIDKQAMAWPSDDRGLTDGCLKVLVKARDEKDLPRPIIEAIMDKRPAALAKQQDPARPDESTPDGLEKFISGYHKAPSPEQVPKVLRAVLKSGLLDDARFKAAPDRLTLVGHAFGHMARGKAKLVRTYEAEFAGAGAAGRDFLLICLRVCGDADTLRRVEKWCRAPRYAALKKSLEATRDHLADPRRKLPRDLPARTPGELDLLWADFLVTGEYAPVSRILDTLDGEDRLRPRIEAWLAKNPSKREGLFKSLRQLHLTRPDAPDRLIAGDLALALIHDERGRGREDGSRAIRLLNPFLDLTAQEWSDALLLRTAASWSLQSNLGQHPRLEELLRRHQGERPPKSRRLLKLWLAPPEAPN